MNKRAAEILAITIMLTGVIMVCQPFWHALFRWGFLVTIAGIIAFTVAAHLPEQRGPRRG